MSTAAPGPTGFGVPQSSAALDRVLRYLLEEIGPQQGPAGAGLARARAPFAALGDPRDRFPAVHVAGTAGVVEIARQKTGILPISGRAVAARQQGAEVEDVLNAEAARRGCDLRWVELGPPAVRAWTGRDGTEVHLRGHPPLSLGLIGRHQAGNAHLALRAVEVIAARDQCAALVATVQEVHPGGRFPWVLAFKRDKDLRAAVQVIAPTAALVVATQFATGDGDHPAGTSVPAEQIAIAAGECGVEAVVEEEPACAVTRAAGEADDGLPVVVSGSFHLLAPVRPATSAP